MSHTQRSPAMATSPRSLRAVSLLGSASIIGAVALLGAGCADREHRGRGGHTLPFTVRLTATSDTVEDDGPARHTLELVDAIARALEEEGVFTRVITSREPLDSADLELTVGIVGSDFGPGVAPIGAAVTSTFVWLLGGHLSWLISNRTFPDSDVAIAYEARAAIRSTSRTPAEPIFGHVLPLDGLSLSFAERMDLSSAFLNIFIPPFIGDGDPAHRSKSLIKKGIEAFRRSEVERLLLTFPVTYFSRTSRYLVFDPDAGEAVIVSRGPIEKIVVRDAMGRELRRIDDRGDVALLEADGEEVSRLRELFSRHVSGVAQGRAGERFYRFGLEPEETGFVSVEVSPSLGGSPTRWTLHRVSEVERPALARVR
jgi:hypothetical protein